MSVHFHQSLDELKNQLNGFSKLVLQQLDHSIHSLAEANCDAAKLVLDENTEVEQFRTNIETECLKMLALYQPVAQDLRVLVACLKVANEAEKIGHRACSIAARTIALDGRKIPAAPIDVMLMHEKTRSMLLLCTKAFLELDANLARQVIEADKEINNLDKQAYQGLESALKDQPAMTKELISAFSASRYLEQIADSIKAVAGDVIYLVEGKIDATDPQATMF
ncbi:MAG: phosphate signaling complex protein PhoU [Bdellovibrionales bacterium]|nr:phosphate signaling complex protein PhoU [Bdellovibrionales bacterium]